MVILWLASVRMLRGLKYPSPLAGEVARSAEGGVYPLKT
jgi:hypothetical protein